MVGRSLVRRKARTALAVLAVIVGAAVATSMLTISDSLYDRLAREFWSFGANIVVLPDSDSIETGLPGVAFGTVTDQGFIKDADLWHIKKIGKYSPNVLGYAPFLYQVVTVTASGGGRSMQAALAGTYFAHVEPNVSATWTTGLQYIASWWDVEGKWVSGDNDTAGAMVGATAAAKLGLQPGSAFSVNYSNPATRHSARRDLVVRGIVRTGGYEDDQIFVNLAVAQELSARPGQVHAVYVSALCSACPAEEIAKDIQMAMPAVRAKSVRQLVTSESSVLSKLDNLMLLVSAAALAASILGVMTALTSGVIERQREIAVMKAVGAGKWRIASLFMTEAAAMGLTGGVAGYAAGLGLAGLIGERVFGASAAFSPSALLLCLGLSVAVAVAGSALPVRRALRIRPAVVLRGD